MLKNGKKVLVALPAGMLEQIDDIAAREHRTRSDLIREALRRYAAETRRHQYGMSRVDSLAS